MERFANIFDLPETQVLITRTYNSEEDQYELKQTASIDGVMADMIMGFHDEDSANEAFLEYCLEDAKHFYDGVKKLMTP